MFRAKHSQVINCAKLSFCPLRMAKTTSCIPDEWRRIVHSYIDHAGCCNKLGYAIDFGQWLNKDPLQVYSQWTNLTAHNTISTIKPSSQTLHPTYFWPVGMHPVIPLDPPLHCSGHPLYIAYLPVVLQFTYPGSWKPESSLSAPGN